MNHPPSLKSPPPPYPDAFVHPHDNAKYGSESGSLHTIQEHHDRRYSVASVASEMVLPHTHSRRGTTSSSGSDESSYTFGQPDSYPYRHPGADSVILGPPSGRLSSPEYHIDDGQSTYSYFPVDPADDPAIMRSMRPHPSPPPSNYAPSLASQRSPLPHRAPTQRSPTFPMSSAQTPYPPSPTRSPQLAARPSPLLGLRNTINPGVYAFRMSSDRTMLLAAPENSTDRTPLYKVEVFPNCFVPTSYITRVHRGNGSYVGQFEMGISKDQPQLYMEPQYYLLKDVFTTFRKVKSNLGDRWIWQRGKVKLHWDCRNEAEISCYRGDDEKKVIAQFRPAGAQPAGAFANGPPQNILEIHVTMDHALLDDIVMSLLIAERRRASPRAGKENEELFN